MPRLPEPAVEDVASPTGADLLEAFRDATGSVTGGFERTVGYEVGLERGTVRIRLEIDDRHVSQYGLAHGGVTLTLLDTVGGVQVYLAVRPSWMATINLSTQFLEPVERGLVVATARIDRLGNAVAHTSMSLHAQGPDGPLLATAVASYRLFRSAP